MKLLNTSKHLVGAAAMLAIGASVAFAQDTTKTKKPTSQTRIKVSKEGTATGEVVRVDTVTVYKTDTLRTTTRLPGRTDTLRLTNTVTRVDTVTVVPMAQPIHLPHGWYLGLGAGGNTPNGALFTPNGVGPIGQVQLGWQSEMLGVRGDGNFTKYGEDSRFGADPHVINLSADAKLQLPFAHHMFGAGHRFGLYGIGGYTYTRFKDLPMRVDDVSGRNLFIVARDSANWQHQNGWNVGGGASLMWGRTELFLESRVLAFKPDNAPQSRQIPIILGMNWY
jgi:opacity protein-like surface antigen